MQQRLNAYNILDPEAFVRDVHCSMQVPDLHQQLRKKITSRASQSDHLPSMLRLLVDKLLTAEDGHRLAFELCFLIKLDGIMIEYGARGSSDFSRFLRNKPLDDIVLNIQKGWWLHDGSPSGADAGFSKDSRGVIDPAAARRRLWASIIARGCRKLDEDSRVTFRDFQGREYCTPSGEEDCVCHRRTSLYLLCELQKRAYGRIRATVMLTLGQLAPVDVRELLFEFAMAAEEIPLNPQVLASNLHEDAERWLRLEPMVAREKANIEPFQRVLRREYRCPQYQQKLDEEESMSGA